MNKEEKSELNLFRRIYIDHETYNYSCGTVYEGSFRESKKQGYGILRLSTGDIYEGEFKDGLRHGSGLMKYYTYGANQCIVYDGDWEKDLRHGYGNVKCSDGSEFSGQWKQGK